MSDWYQKPNAAVAFCIALEALRSDEGHSVDVLCDNPEADSVDIQSAVGVVGDWTDWEPRRFYGMTPLGAILEAGKAQAKARDG